jgi:hypothetical protein
VVYGDTDSLLCASPIYAKPETGEKLLGRGEWLMHRDWEKNVVLSSNISSLHFKMSTGKTFWLLSFFPETVR